VLGLSIIDCFLRVTHGDAAASALGGTARDDDKGFGGSAPPHR
jgi:hypothetical protein